ncbi:MAG TPA: Hsp20/alpha crystallin family protein [Chitinophagaceae bacterium]|nr:Hsp20/alpha crystallin family protein [Chitinophagaceae bacterium]
MTHVKFTRRPFERSFNTLMDDLFTELPVLFKNDSPQPQWKGFVPVNISETDKNYILEVVAPGFNKEDFKLSVDQNTLTISAEKKEQVGEESKRQIRKEYHYKPFKRSFTIDEKTDASAIEAQYVNGVLTINLPKKEIVKETAKEINIK